MKEIQFENGEDMNIIIFGEGRQTLQRMHPVSTVNVLFSYTVETTSKQISLSTYPFILLNGHGKGDPFNYLDSV